MLELFCFVYYMEWRDLEYVFMKRENLVIVIIENFFNFGLLILMLIGVVDLIVRYLWFFEFWIEFFCVNCE